MSLTSWKKEFYPIPASKVKKVDALEHSIQKWTGALRKNTRKHKVEFNEEGIFEKNYESTIFHFDRMTCSLCKFFWKGWDQLCVNCPLLKVNHCCGGEKDRYDLALKTKRPQLMINALKKARKFV